MKRAVHLDFHTMPGICNFGEKWDPALFAKTIKDAHVTCINAVAACNLGFCYYNSKVGVPYPYMKEEIFPSLLEETHKQGIKVVAYISVGLNHEQSRRHSEWCQMNKDGQILSGDRTANFFRTVCYNTGYCEHILSIIDEVTAMGIDGIFCDSVVVRPCYCSACSEKMVKSGYDITNEADVLKFAHKTTYEFSKKIKERLPESMLLRINGLPDDAICDLESHAEIECLPSSVWGYDFFGAAVAYNRNLHDNIVYMTGRFQKCWGDFGGIKSEASIENDIFDALLNNARFSIGDHMHPDCHLEPEVYNMIGRLYSKFEKYEKWTENANYLPEVGVLCNKNNWEEHIPDEKTFQDMWIALPGAARILGELKYNFDIINEDMNFQKFKAIIMPDNVYMTDKMKEKLSAYLKNGGSVLSTGTSGLNFEKTEFALKEWNFLEYCGMDDTKTAYFKNLNHKDVTMIWGMYADGVMAKAGDNTLAAYVKPYFDRRWDGMHGYFYTPPESETSFCAVAEKGIVRHISFKIFGAYYNFAAKYHKDLIEDFLKKHIVKPLIKADDMPSTSRITLTGGDDYKLLHIKVTYPEARGATAIIEEHNELSQGHKISVRGEYKSIKRLPCEDEISFTVKEGYTIIELPKIIGYDMFVLE